MVIVNNGLLIRLYNEAQFASVLGHESAHYLRKHSLASFGDRKTKQNVMAFIGAGANVMAGVSYANGVDGRSWIDLANSINNNLVLSIFRFSREHETEADAYGLDLIERAGYEPAAPATMWRQTAEAEQASAAMRGKRYHRDTSALSTHPPTELRMLELGRSARELEAVRTPGRVYRNGRDPWRAAIAPYREMLIEEQIKLNDPGSSLYLLHSHAADGWDGVLRYYEGEIYRLRDEAGDSGRALKAYATAIALPNPPPEAWRAHGYGLLKAGNAEDGKRALGRYLELKPAAVDAAMVRFSLNS